MKRTLPASLVLASLLSLGLAAQAAPRTITDPQAPRALAAEGPVSVSWSDPSTFSEVKQSRNRFEAERGNWVQQLAEYVRSRAAKSLAPGQTLQVTLLDIKRAGDYEPWRGPGASDVRILRDIYPPRISLQYELKGSNGQVLDSGQADLRNTGYLQTSPRLQSSTDPLRYEKGLIDDWVRRLTAQQPGRALPPGR